MCKVPKLQALQMLCCPIIVTNRTVLYEKQPERREKTL